jgi:hypothetical protein
MIRLRALIKRQRRTLLVAGSLALICLAVAWAHSAPGADHMAGASDHASAALSVCLAVVQGGLGLLAAALGALALRRRRAPLRVAPAGARSATVAPLLTSAPARAGPAELQVFLC